MSFGCTRALRKGGGRSHQVGGVICGVAIKLQRVAHGAHGARHAECGAVRHDDLDRAIEVRPQTLRHPAPCSETTSALFRDDHSRDVGRASQIFTGIARGRRLGHLKKDCDLFRITNALSRRNVLVQYISPQSSSGTHTERPRIGGSLHAGSARGACAAPPPPPPPHQ